MIQVTPSLAPHLLRCKQAHAQVCGPHFHVVREGVVGHVCRHSHPGHSLHSHVLAPHSAEFRSSDDSVTQQQKVCCMLPGAAFVHLTLLACWQTDAMGVCLHLIHTSGANK